MQFCGLIPLYSSTSGLLPVIRMYKPILVRFNKIHPVPVSTSADIVEYNLACSASKENKGDVRIPLVPNHCAERAVARAELNKLRAREVRNGFA